MFVARPLLALTILASTASFGFAADNNVRVDALGDPLPDGALLRMGTLRFRYPGNAYELALSPDEETIVTVGRLMIAWDTRTGKERWRSTGNNRLEFSPPGAAYGSRALVFDPSGGRLYTCGLGGEIVVWDTKTGKRESEIEGPNEVRPNRNRRARGAARSIDITNNGRLFAIGSAGEVLVCDRDGRLKFTIENKPEGPLRVPDRDRLGFFGHYSYARFSPDGKILAAVTSDSPKVLRLHDVNSGKELRRIKLTDRLVRMAFSPDSKRVVLSERDSAVRLYDVDSDEAVWEHTVKLDNPYENYVSDVTFSPDGSTIALGATDYRLYLLDAGTGEETGRLKGHAWYPWSLAFTKDSRLLYSVGWDGVIRRWNVADQKQLGLPQGHIAASAVGASPDGQTLAYEDDRGTIRLQNANDGSELRTIALPGTSFDQLAFSPDGKLLAAGGTAGNEVVVMVWDLRRDKMKYRWAWHKGRDPHSEVEDLEFSPDGQHIAACTFRQDAIRVWNLGTGERVGRMKHNEVYGISFTPDGKSLASAGWDSIVRFWETTSGNLQRELDVRKDAGNGRNAGNADLRMYTVTCSPHGDLFATAHMDNSIRLWRQDDLSFVRRISTRSGFTFGAMTFSPDGLWLGAGHSAGALTLWDPLTGNAVWRKNPHQHYVFTVGFGRDSGTMVSGGSDGVCYQWDLRPENLTAPENLDRLWSDLRSGDSQRAYRAMRNLVESPDEAVVLLGRQLNQISSVIEVERAAQGKTREEFEAAKLRLRKLIERNPKAERLLTVRRAIAVLSQIGTEDAVETLKKLSTSDNKLGRTARSALRTHAVP